MRRGHRTHPSAVERGWPVKAGLCVRWAGPLQTGNNLAICLGKATASYCNYLWKKRGDVFGRGWVWEGRRLTSWAIYSCCLSGWREWPVALRVGVCLGALTVTASLAWIPGLRGLRLPLPQVRLLEAAVFPGRQSLQPFSVFVSRRPHRPGLAEALTRRRRG